MAFQTASATQQWTNMEVNLANNFGHWNRKLPSIVSDKQEHAVHVSIENCCCLWTMHVCEVFVVAVAPPAVISDTVHHTWPASILSAVLLSCSNEGKIDVRNRHRPRTCRIVDPREECRVLLWPFTDYQNLKYQKKREKNNKTNKNNNNTKPRPVELVPVHTNLWHCSPVQCHVPRGGVAEYHHLIQVLCLPWTRRLLNL